MMRSGARPRTQSGFLMLEAMIALFVLLIGLLGLAGLQARSQQAENESYQRSQALILLQDMADRMNANRAAAASYVTASAVGTGNSLTDCATPPTLAESDLCQWSAELLGAAEMSGGTCNTGTGANCIGAMISARGCIANLGATANGPFMIEVVWQGLSPTAAPPSSVACGSGAYGSEAMRRAVTTIVQFANLN